MGVVADMQLGGRTNFHIQVDMCKTQFACKTRSYGANNIEGRNYTFPKGRKELVLNLRDSCVGDVFSSFSFSFWNDASFHAVCDSALAPHRQSPGFVYHILLHGSPDFAYRILHGHPCVLHWSVQNYPCTSSVFCDMESGVHSPCVVHDNHPDGDDRNGDP